MSLPNIRKRRLQHLAREHGGELGEEGAAGGGGGQLANGPARTPAMAATSRSLGTDVDDELEARFEFAEDGEGVVL